MTYQGIDTVARITAAQAKKLRENGVSFVGRYLVPEGMGKDLTAEEIKVLRDAGLAILLCWELGAEAMKGGAARGAQDGARAKAVAEKFGVPSGTTIFFAADYNVQPADLILCEQYMKAAQSALTGKFEAGFYGPLTPVEFLADRGSVKKFWQCVAWSSRFSSAAQTWQYQWQGGADAVAMAKATGILAVDLDTCDDLRRAGMWMPYNEYADSDGGVIIEPTQGNDTSSGADAPPSPQGKGNGMWYDEAMAFVKDAGLMNDGRPNDNLTRAEMATILMRNDKRIDAKITKAMKLLQPEDDSFGGIISD